MNKMNRYLLLQSIENSNKYAFESTIEKALKKLTEIEGLFVVDSLSDGVSMNYAKRFIQESESITVITTSVGSENPPIFTGVFNLLIRKPNTTLYCVNPNEKLTPFIKVLKGRSFASEAELIKALTSLAHGEA